MTQSEKYEYESKEEYSKINKEIVSKKQEENEEKQNNKYYTVKVDYYEYYGMYYLEIPKDYLDQITELRKTKEDIFAKGKILTFNHNNKDNFIFDAVIDSTEDEIYAYFVPIREKFRYSMDLAGEYTVNERNGDLTFIRMKDAIDEFVEGECCSKNIEKYLLGANVSNNRGYNKLRKIINYDMEYLTNIEKFKSLNNNQRNKLDKIFYNEMNTISVNSKDQYKIICLIVYAIYQVRRNYKDKILICSSSNLVADSISLELLNLQECVDDFELLRIYAKNQEIIKRNNRLSEISFHRIIRKNREDFDDKYELKDWIIETSDIIVSTCVNCYNDDLINYRFPFVIIIDANNANENESLIPITLKAKHVVLISFKPNDNEELNLYKRIRHIYPRIHINL